MTVLLETTESTLTVRTVAAAAADELARTSPDLRKVVAWLSRHTAAVEHAVFPVARRALPAAHVAAQEDLTRRLEHVLLALHQSLNGDGRGTDIDTGVATERLRGLLGRHLDGLDVTLLQLAEVRSDAGSALVDRYTAALCNAPSRPHPHTPHGRLGERLAFPVAGAVDRLLDALDSRAVPPLPGQRAGISAPSQA